jgi:putative acetyltransferase
VIREIRQEDDAPLSVVIRGALEEFGANRPGTAYYDYSTDHLYEHFRAPRSVYFVAEADGVVQGGGGIYPSPGLPADTCELMKMYLRPEARGRGLGLALVRRCIEAARGLGYAQIYLESMPELRQALALYERLGWQYLDGPMGNTGHFGCDRWMLMKF